MSDVGTPSPDALRHRATVRTSLYVLRIHLLCPHSLAVCSQPCRTCGVKNRTAIIHFIKGRIEMAEVKVLGTPVLRLKKPRLEAPEVRHWQRATEVSVDIALLVKERAVHAQVKASCASVDSSFPHQVDVRKEPLVSVAADKVPGVALHRSGQAEAHSVPRQQQVVRSSAQVETMCQVETKRLEHLDAHLKEPPIRLQQEGATIEGRLEVASGK